jgi:hypothetical protein
MRKLWSSQWHIMLDSVLSSHDPCVAGTLPYAGHAAHSTSLERQPLFELSRKLPAAVRPLLDAVLLFAVGQHHPAVPALPT